MLGSAALDWHLHPRDSPPRAAICVACPSVAINSTQHAAPASEQQPSQAISPGRALHSCRSPLALACISLVPLHHGGWRQWRGLVVPGRGRQHRQLQGRHALQPTLQRRRHQCVAAAHARLTASLARVELTNRMPWQRWRGKRDGQWRARTGRRRSTTAKAPSSWATRAKRSA